MRYALFLFIFIFFIANLSAQQVKVIPNPSTSKDSSFNYYGPPIIYNNQLFLRSFIIYSIVEQTFELERYDYVNNLIYRIPNPPTANIYGYQGSRSGIFKDKLVLNYENNNGEYQLGIYQKGDSIHLVPNPPTYPYNGVADIGIVFNNKLDVSFVNNKGKTQLGEYNEGDSIHLILNPDNGNGVDVSGSIIYKNKLYFEYHTEDNGQCLAEFDGDSLRLLPIPANALPGETVYAPFVYKNKLYVWYQLYGSAFHELVSFDGKKTALLNPTVNDSIPVRYTGGGLIMFSNNLYFSLFTNSSERQQLASFNGDSIELIKNPDSSLFGCVAFTPFIYKKNLWFGYLNKDTVWQLASYKDGEDSLHLTPNPTKVSAFGGYYPNPIIYHDKFYYRYLDQTIPI